MSQSLGKFSPLIFTSRWYRPLELLFGARLYSSAVDIWSCGCIFAELMLRTPYLPGENDIDQIKTIYKALGSPTENEWPSMTTLPNYVKFDESFLKTPFNMLFTAAGHDAIDLLQKMFIFDPAKRITVDQVPNQT